jgi:predicted O-methyltransferase YrrM
MKRVSLRQEQLLFHAFTTFARLASVDWEMMHTDKKLNALLKELEDFGAENDARAGDHTRKMLNITHETGEFLALLIRAIKARRILEIGTSNGYSTLWLAYAIQHVGGQIDTIERSPFKAELARRNFERAGLAPLIKLHLTEADRFFEEQSNRSYDFVFLDADRGEYVRWWAVLQRIVTPGDLIVVDNIVSHPNELRDFIERVRASPGCMTSINPVGKGELIILKES